MNIYQFFFTLNILFDKLDCCEVETRLDWILFISYFLKKTYGLPKLMTYTITLIENK